MTNHPVDTRPTVSQLSELKYAADGHNGPIWSFTIAQIDCLVEHGYAIPDPAPDAEVPVVEVRRDDLDWAVAELAKQRRAAFVEPDYNEWFAMHSRLKRAAHGPALTKATDR